MIFVKSQPEASQPGVQQLVIEQNFSQQTPTFPNSSVEFEAALKLMKASIIDAVDEKITDMMTRTEAFESKFKA